MNTAEDKAILLHDIRAAMVNHGGLQNEVQMSLLQLTELLQSITPVQRQADESGNVQYDASVRAKVQEIFDEDIDQCLPLLQISSDKLMILLNRLVRDDDRSFQGGDSGI